MARRSVINHPLLPLLVTAALLALIFWLLNSKTPQQPLTNVHNANTVANTNTVDNSNSEPETVNENLNTNANTAEEEPEETEETSQENTNTETNSSLPPTDIGPEDL